MKNLDNLFLHYQTKSEQEKVQFPEQTQTSQPGIESIMNPKPIFDREDYMGSNKLKDKVAIITGGDSGIGKAVAVAFAKEGAKIAIVYYNEHQDANDTKQYIESLDGQCLLIPGDLKDPSFSETVVRQTLDTFTKIDILINNAAVQYPQKALTDISNEQLDTTFKTNIYSMFYLTKAVLPHLKPYSTIINTTSVVAYKGEKELIDYAATKGAIVTFTRSMALNLVDKNIRVNAVAPGPIWTPLQPASWDTQKIPTFGSQAPMKRAGQPVELAPTYVYLASTDSSYVSGQVLHVDGLETTSS